LYYTGVVYSAILEMVGDVVSTAAIRSRILLAILVEPLRSGVKGRVMKQGLIGESIFMELVKMVCTFNHHVHVDLLTIS
jgi:hypothetical protein